MFDIVQVLSYIIQKDYNVRNKYSRCLNDKWGEVEKNRKINQRPPSLLGT